MANTLLYSIAIYLLLFLLLCNHKQNLFLDQKTRYIKSWNFFCNKFNKWESSDDLICFPTIIIIIVILSYFLALKLKK